jgi:hypothetical protein
VGTAPKSAAVRMRGSMNEPCRLRPSARVSGYAFGGVGECAAVDCDIVVAKLAPAHGIGMHEMSALGRISFLHGRGSARDARLTGMSAHQ